jgi:hypothetical protein
MESDKLIYEDFNDDQKMAIKELNDVIFSKNIDINNIVNYVVLLMKIADTYKDISNIEKKHVVLFVIHKYIQTKEVDNVEILKSFIDNILPNVIDTLILVDNKEIVIKTDNYKKSLCSKIKDKLCCLTE